MPVLFQSTTNKTDSNRWGISALRAVMFHHKLDAICSKLFFFETVLFSLALDAQKLVVKLCHLCNFSAKKSVTFSVFHLRNISNTLWLTQQWKRTRLLTIPQKSLTEIVDRNCHHSFAALFISTRILRKRSNDHYPLYSFPVNLQIIVSA